jgi:flagellar biosynthesis protein
MTKKIAPPSQAPEQQAVALRYDPDREPAPRIVATGQGHIAESILRIAEENDIPLHHDSDLLTVLSKLDCGIVVPPRLYEALAKVLAACYQHGQEPAASNEG